MRENKNEDVRPHGGIPLDIIQKYMNYWYSVSIDLFGSEDSTNAANYFAQGLKGRFNEANRKLYPDATAREGVYEYDPFQVLEIFGNFYTKSPVSIIGSNGSQLINCLGADANS